MIDFSTRMIGLVSLATPYFDLETAQANLTTTRTLLGKRYGVLGPEELLLSTDQVDEAVSFFRRNPVDALVIQMGTFPDGEASPLFAQALGVPIVVHSVPEPSPQVSISLNSLCGANATTFTLAAIEHPHVAIHTRAGDPALYQATDAAVVLTWLREARVGLIGSHPGGFYPSAFDEVSLRKTFGVTVEHISMESFYGNDEHTPSRTAPAPLLALSGEPLAAGLVTDLEHRYAVTTDAVAQHRALEAMAIKDWPELWGMWPVLGWLQDEGYTIAVEGDMHAAITMMINKAFTDNSTQMLCDLSAFDAEESTITLWHYGAATELARDPENIRYDDEGQLVQFALKPGEATLARVGTYRGQYRFMTVDVDILDRDVALQRAAGLAKTRNTPSEDVINTMIDGGWEHHLILSYGATAARWKYFAKLLELQHLAL